MAQHSLRDTMNAEVMTKFICVLLLVVTLGCGLLPSPEPEPTEREWQRHELRGKVLQLRGPDIQAAVIEHEDIGEWMGAMTMTFPIRDAAEYAKIQEGDYIAADVVAAGHAEFYLENIQIVDAPIEEPASQKE